MKRGPKTDASSWQVRLIPLLAVLAVFAQLHAVVLSCFAFRVCAAETVGALITGGEERADGCCPEQPASPSEHTDTDDSGGDHENCPCPFPCSVGCSGQPRAVVSAPLVPQFGSSAAVSVLTAFQQRTPPDPEIAGIMRVPKLVVA